MARDNEAGPAWQQNPIFQFFASIRLAMLLLSVLIAGITIGTLYESSFDAKIARAYVYGAPWFNIWLLALCLNLLCSALSRMPWQRHHTGFLITHLGIIVILIGSFIGRTWGIEGTMTLFKGDRPNNMLLVDQRILQIVEARNIGQVVPLELLNHKPTPERPLRVATTHSGWQLAVVGYAPALALSLEPKTLSEGGTPALHVALTTSMMNQKLESWLLADDARNGTFDLGLATITFKRGTASGTSAHPVAPPVNEAVEIEESIFAFANVPDQVGKALKGGSTGAKIKLTDVTAENYGTVAVALGGVTHSFDVKSNLGTAINIPNTNYSLTISNYWADFRIKNGAPESLSDTPNNPCILVTLRGRGIPAATEATPPQMHESEGKNHLTIYLDDSGALTYELASRKAGISTGNLDFDSPLPTGWADWKLTADKVLPHAEEHFNAQPVVSEQKAIGAQAAEGLRVRATRGTESVEEWVPLGWQISLPVQPKPLRLSYGYLQQPLPISLRLLDFEVQRNEGSDSPAGFKSTVEITDTRGQLATGQCWMNNPISYPGSFLNTFSGFTYKLSQASWNPENLNQSTIQILRDPGWGLKWIGSLLVVSGIFSLFYLRPYPNDLVPSSTESVQIKAAQRDVEETAARM